MNLSRLRPAGSVGIGANKRRAAEADAYKDYLRSFENPSGEPTLPNPRGYEQFVPVNAATKTAKEDGALAGIAQWAGGGPAGKGAMSVVTNASHPIARWLSKNYPEAMLALERRPQKIAFDQSPMPEASGEAKFPRNAQWGKDLDNVDLSKLSTVQNPAGNQSPIKLELPNRWSDLPDNNPEKHYAPLHEVLHILYGTNPNRRNLLPPAERGYVTSFGNNRPGLDVSDRPLSAQSRASMGLAERTRVDPGELQYMEEAYTGIGDNAHLALELQSRNMAHRKWVTPAVRDADAGARLNTERMPATLPPGRMPVTPEGAQQQRLKKYMSQLNERPLGEPRSPIVSARESLEYRPTPVQSNVREMIETYGGGNTNDLDYMHAIEQSAREGTDLRIPYSDARIDPDLFPEAAGGYSVRQSPMGEFMPGSMERYESTLPVDPELKERTLRELFQQLLEANTYGQTNN